MFSGQKILSVFFVFAVSNRCYCGTIKQRNLDDDNAETVEYYQKLISSELEKALHYELPTNAKMYEPDDTVIREFGTFDFIIIGAGSTGSVIASRLSEIFEWNVLLLEAGKYPNNFTMIPGFFAVQAMTEYNWGFVSTPQKTACLGAWNNRCVVPRGKGIGGTSLINQVIYSRGNPIDYDRWADLLEDPSWRYENLLHYFKKSEDFHQTNPEAPVDWDYHGKAGYWYTNFHVPPSNFTKLFLRANRELGQNITDYNGKEQSGATILQLNTKEGRRFDQASAFIKPFTSRENLIISTESYVIKIEIDNNTKEATSILFTKNKKTYRAKVNFEIILSAGAISSPQILMLSGIGPKQHLNLKEIPLVQDLEVGSNLRDHVFCSIPFASSEVQSEKSLQQQITEFLNGYGDLTAGNPLDAAVWYKTYLETISNYPDIEIIPTYSPLSELGRKFLQWDQETWKDLQKTETINPFSLTVILLHTESKGTVRLRSKNAYEYPNIDNNVLSDVKRKDIRTLYEGIQLAINISKTKAFQEIDATLMIPPLKDCSEKEYLSKEFWECYLRHMSIPAFHPIGTCPSGTNPAMGAVVYPDLKVFGIKKLRVVDASVIPHTMSGHPNAVCTMIGEKLSDVIKNEYK